MRKCSVLKNVEGSPITYTSPSNADKTDIVKTYSGEVARSFAAQENIKFETNGQPCTDNITATSFPCQTAASDLDPVKIYDSKIGQSFQAEQDKNLEPNKQCKYNIDTTLFHYQSTLQLTEKPTVSVFDINSCPVMDIKGDIKFPAECQNHIFGKLFVPSHLASTAPLIFSVDSETFSKVSETTSTMKNIGIVQNYNYAARQHSEQGVNFVHNPVNQSTIEMNQTSPYQQAVVDKCRQHAPSLHTVLPNQSVEASDSNSESPLFDVSNIMADVLSCNNETDDERSLRAKPLHGAIQNSSIKTTCHDNAEYVKISGSTNDVSSCSIKTTATPLKQAHTDRDKFQNSAENCYQDVNVAHEAIKQQSDKNRDYDVAITHQQTSQSSMGKQIDRTANKTTQIISHDVFTEIHVVHQYNEQGVNFAHACYV